MKWIPCFALLVLVLSAPAAGAGIMVDGTLDPDYGTPLAVQTTQTSIADALEGDLYHTRGSELDGAYGFISDGVLHLFLAGNIGFCCGEEFQVVRTLNVFFDTGAGGQNVLRADNSTAGFPGSVAELAGLTFDAGLAPGYWLGGWTYGLWYSTLPAGSGGTAYCVGYVDVGPPGTVTLGTNPYGILASTNSSNTGGVTAGCGAASGAGVLTGEEWAIPLVALGNPTDCVRVCAFLAYESQSAVSNQVLGPVPPGMCDLGAPSAVNFANLEGAQYFTVCPAGVPARAASWGKLKATYR